MRKKVMIAFLSASVSLTTPFSHATDSSCYIASEFNPESTPAGWNVDYASPITRANFSFSKDKTYVYVATVYSSNPEFHYQHFICLYQEKDCLTQDCPSFTIVSPNTFAILSNPSLYNIILPNLPPNTKVCQPAGWKGNPNSATNCIF